MPVDDIERKRAEENRAVRGYIIRSLWNANNNTMILRQLVGVMINDGVILAPDISLHLEYLLEGGYVRFTNDKIKAHSAYRNDAVVKLTKKGTDLVEESIPDDAGIKV